MISKQTGTAECGCPIITSTFDSGAGICGPTHKEGCEYFDHRPIVRSLTARIAELEAYTERLRGASSQTSNVDYLIKLEAANARLKTAVEWALSKEPSNRPHLWGEAWFEFQDELRRRASGEKHGLNFRTNFAAAPAGKREGRGMNLMEGLIYELNRNRELLKLYTDIGPAGAFGAMFIKQSIKDAEAAMGSGDTIAMLQCYSALKGNKE